ncbi:MAG: glycosyl hydrolase [Candidatus Aminicenantes bacterium]|nr:glycosyl hydrolase [Candidatus Aminicenantes bacterium]
MKRLFLTIFLISILVLGLNAKKVDIESSPVEKALSGLKFRSIGPAFMSGRIADLAIDPKDTKTWYVAVGSGGVWKTTNSGTTFKPIFDAQSSYSIGCITIDPNNSNIIWVGSGENVSGRHVGYGDGVYKSADGGQSWKNMGLKKSEHIDKIVIDPTNSDIIFVAAEGPLWSAGGERGIFKSIDGGETWKASLAIDKDTGATDIVMDPRDPKILYAAAHQRRRHVSALINGGPGSAIYKTYDGGENWAKITKGLPKENLGQIALAISPQRPDVIYASVETAIRKITFYRSSDGGQNWKKKASYNTPGTGPHYYQELFASPHQFDKIYSMEINILFSNDGGGTWGKISEDKKHGDNHALAFHPDEPGYLLAGSDGGIYETWDMGKSWRYISNLPITQYYRIAVDNEKPFYNVLGGTQDNCTQLGPSRTTRRDGIWNSDWRITMGGDGYTCQFDPKDPNIMYTEAQVGYMIRYDKRNGDSVPIRPIEEPGEDANRWNWDAPLIISPHNSNRLYFPSQRLYKSEDRGDTWTAISGDLSKGINRLEEKFMGRSWSINAVWDNDAMSYYSNVVTIDESPLMEGLIYCGTDDGLIQVTDDGGKNWRKIDKFPGIPYGTFVNEVMASKHERDTVYALFDDHKRGNFKPYILKSMDRGKSWKSITGNIPDKYILWSIEQDHVDKDILFLGTEFGVHCTITGGNNWMPLKSGIPTIAVRDIKIQKRENDLVCGTFGRGFYILDDYSPLRKINETELKKDFILFPVKPALQFNLMRVSGGGQGHTFFQGKNPKYGTTITYYMKESLKSTKDLRKKREKELAKAGKDVPFPGWDNIKKEEREVSPKLILQITNEKDEVIRRLDVSAKKGLHRVNWDLRESSQNEVRLSIPKSSSPFSYSWRYRRRGHTVLPGKYYVTAYRMTDGAMKPVSQKESISCLPMAGKELPDAVMKDISAFYDKYMKLDRDFTALSSVIGKMNEGLKYMKKALPETRKDNGNFLADIIAMEGKLKDISNELWGDSTKRNRSEPAKPGISSYFWDLGSKFGSILRPVRDYEKTKLEKIRGMFMTVKNKVRLIQKEDFAKLIKRAKELGAPWIPGFGLNE